MIYEVTSIISCCKAVNYIRFYHICVNHVVSLNFVTNKLHKKKLFLPHIVLFSPSYHLMNLKLIVKWIHRFLEPIQSGITQDFVPNRSPSIKNTNTDDSHIGFIANRLPEVAHKLLAMVS